MDKSYKFDNLPLAKVPESDSRLEDSQMTIPASPSLTLGSNPVVKNDVLGALIEEEESKSSTFGLKVNAAFDDLVDEESDDDDFEAPNYLDKKKSSTKEDSVTANIEAKLKFRDFRAFRKVKNINDIYKLKKKLGEGAFGKVFEA